jgi:hypothetical protein
LTGFFSPAARGPSAEGRSILTILLILSNLPLKIRIYSVLKQLIEFLKSKIPNFVGENNHGN